MFKSPVERQDRIAQDKEDFEKELHWLMRYKGDDGCGPYLCWDWSDEKETEELRNLWLDFDYWAYDNFGQGYSLACQDGDFIDPVVFWAFKAYVEGRKAKSPS